MKIQLTLNEYCHAVREAATRMQISKSMKIEDPKEKTPRSYQQMLYEETIGMCAELAFAKHYNAYATMEINTFKDVPDIIVNGHGVEIRACDGPNDRLILRKPDKYVDRPFVLVQRHSDLVYEIRGWFLVADVDDDWIYDANNEGRPAWFVPNEALYSLDALEERLGLRVFTL